MKEEHAFRLSNYFFGLMIAILLVVMVVIVWPYEPYEQFNNPIPVINGPVEAGTPILYNVSFCKYTDTRATVSKYLINSEVITFASYESNTKKGCRNVVMSMVIPAHVSPGTYRLHINLEYRINFLRTVSYKMETEAFNVV